jgi:putative ABC transport system ATP-binding protein
MTSQAITLNAGANGNQTSTANMIELEGVEKVYRTDRIETVALTNVNLSVRAGEFISIMGPSGSGKSTLLNVIGLLDVPTGGKVTLNNQPVTSYSDRSLSRVRNEQIGFVFQTFHLINDLSVVDNAEIPLLYRKNLSGSERRKLALRALDRVGLRARVHHFPSQLSGGQQQRVAIARAIVGNPRILLADEPTGNLDSQMGDEIMETLKDLNENEKTTILIVTHDSRQADKTERIVRLFDGRQVS